MGWSDFNCLVRVGRMLRLAIIFFLLKISPDSAAVLLDKTLAVVDEKVITLSEVPRVLKTVPARRNIIPGIYDAKKLNRRKIAEIEVRKIIIRRKLEEVGYTVSDEEVERNINDRKKALGINHDALVDFLKNNGLLFNEYFEITRQALEYARFNSWIIRPLISVTEQDIKEVFYKENLKNKSLSFKYSLIDFSLEKSKFKGKMLKGFKNALKKLQKSGIMLSAYKELQTNKLGDIVEDDLEKRLRDLLKKTEEGTFSDPYLMNGRYHIFYVKEKNLVSSELFRRERKRIEVVLLQKEAKRTEDLWFESEKSKHYVKYFFNKS
ncbi:MAG: hypothetical protein OXB84_06490 [Halobacteriovoraceae bacterium]|nr:hypothetical protein [Halobacteriovoraceae bacterium]